MAAVWTRLLRTGGVAVAALAAACGGGGGGTDDAEVLVFAAASLTDAFSDLESAFEAANPGVDVELNLAGSSRLREQILAGAPADVFAAADEATMAAVVDAGLAPAPTVFAHNRLALAVPADNPAAITSLADLERPELLVGLCAVGVPCGDLARAGLAQAGIEASIDTEEPDVRSLLNKLAAGELDAGMVYTTDVLAAADVVSVPLPPSVDVVAVYPIVALDDAPAGDLAQAFVAFVSSPDGLAILADHGFEAP